MYRDQSNEIYQVLYEYLKYEIHNTYRGQGKINMIWTELMPQSDTHR